MPKAKYPTLEAIQEVIEEDSHLGWCINCGDWTHDTCEPDAHKYTCPVCECQSCYGAEELIIMDMFE